VCSGRNQRAKVCRFGGVLINRRLGMRHSQLNGQGNGSREYRTQGLTNRSVVKHQSIIIDTCKREYNWILLGDVVKYKKTLSSKKEREGRFESDDVPTLIDALQLPPIVFPKSIYFEVPSTDASHRTCPLSSKVIEVSLMKRRGMSWYHYQPPKQTFFSVCSKHSRTQLTLIPGEGVKVLTGEQQRQDQQQRP